MGKFVVPDIPSVDKCIKNDLDIIRQRLFNFYKNNLVALILCGGFGRGEGSIVKEGDQYKPCNDYDLLLVTRNRVSKNTLHKLSRKLAQEIGIRFVDLGVVKLSSLSKLTPSIFAYDMSHSNVIFGEKTIINKIRKFQACDIPIEEARRILLNRLICFLELTPDGFLTKKDILLNQHRLLVLQLSKAVIAAAVAWLTEKGKYDSSYQKQLSNFLKISSHEDHDLVSLAYNLKLGLVEPETVDPWLYWQEAKKFYLKTFNKFIMPGIDLEEFVHIHSQKVYSFQYLYNWIKGIMRFLIYRESLEDSFFKKKIEVLTLLSIVAVNDDYSISQKNFSLLTQNIHYLSKQGFQFRVDCWKSAKNICVELWEKYHH